MPNIMNTSEEIKNTNDRNNIVKGSTQTRSESKQGFELKQYEFDRMKEVIEDFTEKDYDKMNDFLSGVDSKIPDDKWLFKQFINTNHLLKNLSEFVKKQEISAEKQPALYDILRKDDNKKRTCSWDFSKTDLNTDEGDIFYAAYDFFNITSKPNSFDHNSERQKQLYLNRCGILRWFFRFSFNQKEVTLDNEVSKSAGVVTSELPICEIISCFHISNEILLEKTWGNLEHIFRKFTSVLSLKTDFFENTIKDYRNTVARNLPKYNNLYIFTDTFVKSNLVRNFINHDNRENNFPINYTALKWFQIYRFILFFYIGLIALIKKSWKITLKNNEETYRLFLKSNKPNGDDYHNTRIYQYICDIIGNDRNNSILKFTEKKIDDLRALKGYKHDNEINTIADTFYKYLEYINNNNDINDLKYPITYNVRIAKREGINQIKIDEKVIDCDTDSEYLELGAFETNYYDEVKIEFSRKDGNKVNQSFILNWSHKDGAVVTLDPGTMNSFITNSYSGNKNNYKPQLLKDDLESPAEDSKSTSHNSNEIRFFSAKLDGIDFDFEVIKSQLSQQDERSKVSQHFCTLVRCINTNSKKRIILPQDITSPNGSTFTIRRISPSAFEGCQFSQIILPDSIKIIEERAFAECSKLRTISVGLECETIGKQAFFNCTQLNSIILRNHLKEIGKESFCGCTSLEQITLPSSLIVINEAAFMDCSRLKKITIVKGIKEIGKDVFQNCTALTAINLPDSVTDIGKGCFMNSAITKFTIPDSVTKVGDLTFANCKKLTSITIPNSVTIIGYCVFLNCTSLTCVGIPNSVVSLGASAFNGCIKLKTVALSEKLSVIEKYSFGNCFSLTSIVIPHNVVTIGEAAFLNCSKLSNISLSSNLKSINGGAFQTCSALTHITLPNSLISIGEVAFYDCTGLTSIIIPNNVQNIADTAFGRCCNIQKLELHCNKVGIWALNLNSTEYLIIGKEVTYIDRTVIFTFKSLKHIELHCKTIGSWFKVMPSIESVEIGNEVTCIEKEAFYDCEGLIYTNILSSVTSIGDRAFSWCKRLTYITIPNSVTSIGNDAFHNCINLTSVTIPNGIISIGSSAFASCGRLRAVTFPNSVTSIGSNAFGGCCSLTSVKIPNSVTRIEDDAFSGCLDLTSITIPNSVTSIGKSAFERCSGLTSITIPSSVTSIGMRAFAGCKKLTSIKIPNSVTSIGDEAFHDCICLTSVTIGNSVTNIGKSAFEHCRSLTSITIPNSVTSIGDEAFHDCICLTSVTIGHGVTSIGREMFASCNGLTSVIVPDNVTSIEKYAFNECINLEKIIFSKIKTLQRINEKAYAKCFNIKEIEIRNKNQAQTISPYSFIIKYKKYIQIADDAFEKSVSRRRSFQILFKFLDIDDRFENIDIDYR